MTKIVIESENGSKGARARKKPRRIPFAARAVEAPNARRRKEGIAMENERDSLLLAVCTLIELLVAKGVITPEEIRRTAAEMEEALALRRSGGPHRPTASDGRGMFRTA